MWLQDQAWELPWSSVGSHKSTVFDPGQLLAQGMLGTLWIFERRTSLRDPLALVQDTMTHCSVTSMQRNLAAAQTSVGWPGKL